MSLLICPGLFAQNPATNAPPVAGSNSAAVRSLRSRLPVPKPPVDFFRELLAMTPYERTQALTNRSPESQKAILAKVNEYAALDPDQRELRLRVTELRWYLWPLMNMTPTNRAARLATIPDADRELIAVRLQQWDSLSAERQQQLLANEITMRYLTGTIGEKIRFRSSLSPEDRARLEEGLNQWRQMSAEQRQDMTERFEGLFNLSAREKERALKTLSEAERRQIEKTLREFGNLTQAQQDRCVSSFEKFANFSPEERQQFLEKAELWKLMSPSERQSWKELVKVMPRKPALPPSLARHLVRPVLLPSHSTNRAPAVATNPVGP